MFDYMWEMFQVIIYRSGWIREVAVAITVMMLSFRVFQNQTQISVRIIDRSSLLYVRSFSTDIPVDLKVQQTRKNRKTIRCDQIHKESELQQHIFAHLTTW